VWRLQRLVVTLLLLLLSRRLGLGGVLLWLGCTVLLLSCVLHNVVLLQLLHLHLHVLRWLLLELVTLLLLLVLLLLLCCRRHATFLLLLLLLQHVANS
jgi:hypothetical protein